MNRSVLLILALLLIASLAYPQTVIYLTSGSSWTVPADWNNSANSIEVIGGGGAGYSKYDSSSGYGGGGGGGGYSKLSNLTLTPGNSVGYAVGLGGTSEGAGGGNTYFCNSISNCTAIGASAVRVAAAGGGGGYSDGGGGAGAATTSAKGDVKSVGGAGGNGYSHPGGGGGAGGPFGVGAAGYSGTGSYTSSGGGGGGGGAAATSNVGGNNHLGSGGGATGAAGTAGGGGGGATSSLAGGAGGPGSEWNSTHGSGGGGGSAMASGASLIPGNGGLYGGGGAGGGNSNFGSGAAGIIVITYTPAPVGTTYPVTAADSGSFTDTIAVAHSFAKADSETTTIADSLAILTYRAKATSDDITLSDSIVLSVGRLDAGSIFTDVFTRSNSSTLGSSWAQPVGQMAISNNTAIATAVSGIALATVSSTYHFGSDQYATIAVASWGQALVGVRYGNPNQGYVAYCTSTSGGSCTTFHISEWSSGTLNDLSTITGVLVPVGAQLRLQAKGSNPTTVSLWNNGALLGKYTDNLPILGGTPAVGGVSTYASNAGITYFDAGTPSANDAYATPLSSPLAIADSLVSVMTPLANTLYSSNKQDAVAVMDSLLVTAILGSAAQGDRITLLDAVAAQVNRTNYPSISETVTLTDALVRTTRFARSLSDAVTLSSSAVYTKTVTLVSSLTVGDSFAVMDSLTRQLIARPAIADGFSVTGTLVLTVLRTVHLVDSLIPSPSLTGVVRHVASVSDTLAMLDANTVFNPTHPRLFDAAGITDVLVRVVVRFNRSSAKGTGAFVGTSSGSTYIQ